MRAALECERALHKAYAVELNGAGGLARLRLRRQFFRQARLLAAARALRSARNVAHVIPPKWIPALAQRLLRRAGV